MEEHDAAEFFFFLKLKLKMFSQGRGQKVGLVVKDHSNNILI